MPGERVVTQSEVVRAMLLEDSPCCGVPHLGQVADRVIWVHQVGRPLVRQRLGRLAELAVGGHNPR